jgi:hypothetical protein
VVKDQREDNLKMANEVKAKRGSAPDPAGGNNFPQTPSQGFAIPSRNGYRRFDPESQNVAIASGEENVNVFVWCSL